MSALETSPVEGLSDEHYTLLHRDSAISREHIEQRGYRTVTKKVELRDRGFEHYQQQVPALLIPSYDAHGDLAGYQSRPNTPRLNSDGKIVKYDTPAGAQAPVDIPTAVRAASRDTETPIYITEGIRKADAAVSAGIPCISIPGVWAWSHRDGDTRTPHPSMVAIKWHGRTVTLCFDSDAYTNPNVHHALTKLADWLTAQGATVRYCVLPQGEDGRKIGLDDFLVAGHDADDLRALETDAMPPAPEAAVKRAPARPTDSLLERVIQTITRYVHLDSVHLHVALALYVLHTWAFEAAAATPYLYVYSPVRESGKTRLLEVLEYLVREPLRTSNASAAAIFQSIAAKLPTLLVDEADAIFTGRDEHSEALRGTLNAGTRPGTPVLRGSQEGEAVEFDVYCPKVIAGIDTGHYPDTLRSRSIDIPMNRKERNVEIARFRMRKVERETAELRKHLGDWAAEQVEGLADYVAEDITKLSDRQTDAWEALLGIADLAGGEWPQRARDAAIELAGRRRAAEVENNTAMIVLDALRSLFIDSDADAMSSEVVCQKLNDDETLPFGNWHRAGEGINPIDLAKLLRPLEIKPKPIRIDGHQHRGYRRDGFAEVWARYLPPVSPEPEDIEAAEEKRTAQEREQEQRQQVAQAVASLHERGMTTVRAILAEQSYLTADDLADRADLPASAAEKVLRAAADAGELAVVGRNGNAKYRIAVDG